MHPGLLIGGDVAAMPEGTADAPEESQELLNSNRLEATTSLVVVPQLRKAPDPLLGCQDVHKEQGHTTEQSLIN